MTFQISCVVFMVAVACGGDGGHVGADAHPGDGFAPFIDASVPDNGICNALDDNDFLGSASHPGSACTASRGCYGEFASGKTTQWRCASPLTGLTHGARCLNDCASTTGPYVNGCAPGYVPLLLETTGTTTVICSALCKPGNTYLGNPGTQFPAGQAPHRCSTGDARGVFKTATTTTNGDHCAFLSRFELDDTGTLPQVPTDDIGICYDHTRYRFNNQELPRCASLPDGYGSGDALGAADLGCVDSSHDAMSSARRRHVLDLRLPYYRSKLTRWRML